MAFESVGNDDTSSQMNFCALNALMLYRKNEIQQAWIFAGNCNSSEFSKNFPEQVYTCITSHEPTAFFTFLAYSILPELYINMLHNQKVKKKCPLVHQTHFLDAR